MLYTQTHQTDKLVS